MYYQLCRQSICSICSVCNRIVSRIFCVIITNNNNNDDDDDDDNDDDNDDDDDDDDDNFWKFKVALIPTYKTFLCFAKSCVLSCLSKVDNIKKIDRAVFELQVPKAIIKGVISKSYCCYGNLL